MLMSIKYLEVAIKRFQPRVSVSMMLGISLWAGLSWKDMAIARDTDAGVGYSNSRDVSYCSTSLIAREQDARINVRHGPGTVYDVEHYGLVNDWVDILNRNGNPNVWMSGQDKDGYSWYQIGFPESRAYGWVREDFLRFPPEECRD